MFGSGERRIKFSVGMRAIMTDNQVVVKRESLCYGSVMTNNLTIARGAFAVLLNALDDARADVTDAGEDEIDALVASLEHLVRRFDAAFDAKE